MQRVPVGPPYPAKLAALGCIYYSWRPLCTLFSLFCHPIDMLQRALTGIPQVLDSVRSTASKLKDGGQLMTDSDCLVPNLGLSRDHHQSSGCQ